MKVNSEIGGKMLAAAVAIGDDILSKAKKEKSGLSWETLSLDNDQAPVWTKSESIYGGVSGIVLFLLQLYKVTHDQKYLDAAEGGVLWLEDYCKNTPTDYYPFLTGRMGVSFAMLRTGQITGNDKYIKIALDIARGCDGYLNSANVMDEYINGSSGILVCLIHLHAATNEEWLLEKINTFVGRILNSCFSGPDGIYWDRSEKNIHGLCGFSHGVAGIGFALLEVGHYFQNPAFYVVAEQAFLYENHYFDSRRNNWPDFRKGIFTRDDYEQYKAAYLEGNVDFFTTPGYMSNWCHGANGIGLSRARAYELLQREAYKKDLDVSVNTTIATTIKVPSEQQSQCYCHGESGDAEVFLEAYRVLKDHNYLNQAFVVAEKLLRKKEESGFYHHGYSLLRQKQKSEDISLYMGNAGVGYFYLKLLDPLNTESLLASSVRVAIQDKKGIKKYPFLDISEVEIKKKIIGLSYHRTLAAIEKLFSEKWTGGVGEKDIAKGFEKFVSSQIGALSAEDRDCLTDLFSLEKAKKQLNDGIKSDAWFNMQTVIGAELFGEIKVLKREEFLMLRLKSNDDIIIHESKWDWSVGKENLYEQNFKEEASKFHTLLKPTYMGVSEIPLNDFVYIALSAFKEPVTVQDACGIIMDEFESVPDGKKTAIEDQIIRQVKEMMVAGMLEVTTKT